MNASFVVVFVLAIGFAVAIPWAVRYDRVMAELEALDDEPFAAEAAAAWNRGEWK